MHVRQFRQKIVSQLDRYLIIDIHGGQQDIFALITALKLAQRYDKIILGITCVNGRRQIEQVIHDALIAQQIVGTKIPVYIGSKQSILLKNTYPPCHGYQNNSSKLNHIQLTNQSKSLIQKQSAPYFISQQIKKYSSQLCIITFGPLTNIALAYHRIQDIKDISSIRINGGAFSGVGNVINSSGSEGNFYYDPQAAHIAISNYTNVYINSIEKTLETSFEGLLKDLKLSNGGKNKKFEVILDILLGNQVKLNGPLLTLMPAFIRHSVHKVLSVYSQVINQGQNIVGLLAPNWLRLEVKENEQNPNIQIYWTFDMDQISKAIKLLFQ